MIQLKLAFLLGLYGTAVPVCFGNFEFLINSRIDYHNWQYKQFDGETVSDDFGYGWIGETLTSTFHTCSWGKPIPQNNWLISPHIHIPDNVTKIEFDMKYVQRMCNFGDPMYNSDNCKLALKLYIYYVDSPQDNVTNNSFTTLETLTPQLNTQVTEERLYPLDTNFHGLYLALQDQGTCVDITEIRVKYFYCPREEYRLWTFPRSLPSTNDYYGNCKQNSSPSPMLTKKCQDDGNWHADNLNGDCVCNQGYELNNTGLVYFCKDQYCGMSPCRNYGTCQNTGTGYLCSCDSSYYGVNCTKIYPCNSDPCKNGGTCFNNGDGYTCKCLDAYKGTICTTAVNGGSNLISGSLSMSLLIGFFVALGVNKSTTSFKASFL